MAVASRVPLLKLSVLVPPLLAMFDPMKRPAVADPSPRVTADVVPAAVDRVNVLLPMLNADPPPTLNARLPVPRPDRTVLPPVTMSDDPPSRLTVYRLPAPPFSASRTLPLTVVVPPLMLSVAGPMTAGYSPAGPLLPTRRVPPMVLVPPARTTVPLRTYRPAVPKLLPPV